MCGCYNGASASDAATAEHASAYVVAHWPREVRLLFSGFEVGVRVQSGGRLSSCQPKSPAAAAFENYEHGPNKSRYSWDPLTPVELLQNTFFQIRACCISTAAARILTLAQCSAIPHDRTLVAVRGVAAAHCRECTDCNGTNRVDPNSGNNRWIAGPARNQTYIVLEDGAAAGATLDDLLCQTPKRASEL